MHIDLGNLMNKLLLAEQVEQEFEALKKLAVGAAEELPLIKIRLFGGRFEVGPIPVKRTG